MKEGGGWRSLVSRAGAEGGGERGGGAPRGGWGKAMGGRRMLGTLLRVAGGVGVMGLLGGVAYVYEVRRKSDAYRVLWQEKKDEIEYQVFVCVCVCVCMCVCMYMHREREGERESERERKREREYKVCVLGSGGVRKAVAWEKRRI